MQTLDLDTILLPDDVAQRARLSCLSCRTALGSACYVDRHLPDGTKEITVSLAVQSVELKDVARAPGLVTLVCFCGCRSTYHLL